MGRANANRLLTYLKVFKSHVAIGLYRVLGASIGKDCRLYGLKIPQSPWHVEIGDEVNLDDGVTIVCVGECDRGPKVKLHSHVYINRFSMIDASLSIEIGEHTLIGPYTYITDHDHGQVMGTPMAGQPLHSLPVRIGRDVWIGAGVIILKGVVVGDGAVVGAGAVVTRDVAANTRVVGIPAAASLRRRGSALEG